MIRRSASAFTFIEVLCVLLVVIVGIGGVVSLVAYGMEVASRARGETTGLATAISIAKDPDPSPMLPSDVAADWTPPTPAIDINQDRDISSQAMGFVNGFYVIRKEESKFPQDVIAASGTAGTPGYTVYVRSCRVEVNVYESFNGNVAASYVTRIVRQRGRP